MKKIIAITLSLLMLASLASCSNNENNDGKVTDDSSAITSDSGEITTNDTTSVTTETETETGTDTSAEEGSLEDIIQQMYDSVDTEWPMVANTELVAGDEGNLEYYIGTKNVDLVRGVANEAMISAVAHSVVLLEVKDGSDIEAIKEDIKTNVNPYKWVCVGVEDKDVRVESEGNLICLIMVNDYSEQLAEAFHEIAADYANK